MKRVYVKLLKIPKMMIVTLVNEGHSPYPCGAQEPVKFVLPDKGRIYEVQED